MLRASGGLYRSKTNGNTIVAQLAQETALGHIGRGAPSSGPVDRGGVVHLKSLPCSVVSRHDLKGLRS